MLAHLLGHLMELSHRQQNLFPLSVPCYDKSECLSWKGLLFPLTVIFPWWRKQLINHSVFLVALDEGRHLFTSPASFSVSHRSDCLCQQSRPKNTPRVLVNFAPGFVFTTAGGNYQMPFTGGMRYQTVSLTSLCQYTGGVKQGQIVC